MTDCLSEDIIGSDVPGQTRRAFLAASAAVVCGAVLPRASSASPRESQRDDFRGAHAGAERTVDDVRLCWCPPGRFRMGSPLSERGRRPDEDQVDVVLTRGFWIGKYEVTQSEWRRLMGAFPDRLPTPAFGEGENFPMYWVNFHEAQAFCSALTARARNNGSLHPAWSIALPTEAQWEYACRAETTTAWAFGGRAETRDANFDAQAETRLSRLEGGARPVGSYAANAWGIHDMHGNVWEWCRDYYHAQLVGGRDPDRHDVPGVQNGDGTFSRVRRGGAWIESAAFCRSAARLRYEPHRRSDHIGFRVVAVET